MIILLYIGGLVMHNRLEQKKNTFFKAYTLPRMIYEFDSRV